jgi:hypothetical protein
MGGTLVCLAESVEQEPFCSPCQQIIPSFEFNKENDMRKVFQTLFLVSGLISLLNGCAGEAEEDIGRFEGNTFISESLGWTFEVPPTWEMVDLYDHRQPDKGEPQGDDVLRAFAFHNTGRQTRCIVRIYDYDPEVKGPWKEYIKAENNKLLQELLQQNYPASAGTTTYPIKNVPFNLFEIYPPSFETEGGLPGFAMMNAWIENYRLEIGFYLESVEKKNFLLDQLERSDFTKVGKE